MKKLFFLTAFLALLGSSQTSIAQNCAIDPQALNSTCGGLTGAVTLSVLGGSQNFTFAWSNGATTQHITGLAPGTYCVTATNFVVGCSATACATVGGGSSQITATVAKTNVSCFGGNNGTAIATPTGQGPFTYHWSSGQTGQTANSLTAGTYTVTVTGPGGCTASATTNIQQPTAPLTLSTQITNPPCGQYLGNINLSVSGGTAGYTYQWSSSNGNFCFGSQDPNNTTPGNYTVTVTDSHGCTATKVTTVLIPVCPPDTLVVICDTTIFDTTYVPITIPVTVYDTNHAVVNVNDTTITHTSIIISDTSYVSVTVNDTTWVPVLVYDTTYTPVLVQVCDTNAIHNTWGIGYGDENFCPNGTTSGQLKFFIVPGAFPSQTTFAWTPSNGEIPGTNGTQYFPNVTQGYVEVNCTATLPGGSELIWMCFHAFILPGTCSPFTSDTVEGREDPTKVLISPNPTNGNGQLNVSGLPTGTHIIKIFDMLGRPEATEKIIVQ